MWGTGGRTETPVLQSTFTSAIDFSKSYFGLFVAAGKSCGCKVVL